MITGRKEDNKTMTKKRVIRNGILILIVLVVSLALVQSVTAKNVFYTTQELNRTQPMEVTGYPTAGLEDNLVGYWKCDGDFTDSSGYGNDGTQSGGFEKC